jgi:dihydroflavonol-4-reductase
MMAQKQAFVTGATGFLGINLIEQLTADNWNVTAIFRSSSKTDRLKKLKVNFVPGTLDDKKALIQVIPANVDAVFHVAADTSFWQGDNERQTRTNVDGTRNVVEAAIVKEAKRFIHTSSVAVYGIRDEAATEDTSHHGISSKINYFHTKALAEQEVRNGIKNGLDAVILNPANIIGPHDAHNWGRSFRIVLEDKLPGIPPGKGSFAHVVEVAKAHVAAFEKGKTGENYNLGGPTATYQECFELIAKLLSVPLKAKPTPAVVLRLLGGYNNFVSHFTKQRPEISWEIAEILCGGTLCTSDKAIRELGYKTTSLERMFGDCYQWLAANGFIKPGSAALSEV